MEIDRRSLMKGMLASGALVALGSPAWAFAAQSPRPPRHCVLLLSFKRLDHSFERGGQAASMSISSESLHTVKLEHGLLAGEDKIVTLLRQQRGARWIAVLDHASAVIFVELTRTAGAKMLFMGMHASSSDAACSFRHDLATASAPYSAGGFLASHFSNQQVAFSITERFLCSSPPQNQEVASWAAPGFSSYRLAGPEEMHVHCSGCSLPDGCRLLNWERTEGWIPIPPQAGACESFTWKSQDWVESVGYAVTAAALRGDAVRESCTGRAFVHQASRAETMRPMERFVTLIMDI